MTGLRKKRQHQLQHRLRRTQCAQRALQQFVLTGNIRVDARLLADFGFRPAQAQQLLAANTVRELMPHYWFPEPLTMANAQELLKEWRQREGARWLTENREALQSSNEYVEEQGLPLGKFQR